MIRRNIIGVVGVCAALAVGIALGAGPLSSHDTSASTPAVVQADPALKSAAAFGQKWATQVGPDLYAGRLHGRRVALITLPGARASTVQQLRDGISVAKGVVASDVALTPSLLDPNRKVAVDTLGAQFARQSQGTVDPQLPPYERLGQMLGMAVARAPMPQYAAPGRRNAAASVAITAQETLRTAKLADISGAQGPAGVVLVVLGPHGDPDIVADLLRGLATKVTGIVVAGGTGSGAHGVLASLRQQHWNARVMTVDGIETVYGRTAALTGLVSQLTPHGGSYGASGIDGLVPLG